MSLTSSQKRFTLVGTLLAMFLAALDQTVVATAGPSIQKALAISPAHYAWMTTAYLVSSTVLVPVYGRLSDVWGRKKVVVSGVAVFLVASVLCGLSRSTWQLIAARALQGVGSASIFTTSFAVVADLFPPSERGKYTGLFGSMFGLSSLVGPLLGGFITDTFGWHWVFLVNLPIGAVALAFILSKMPPLLPALEAKPTVDWAGALLLSVGTVPLLLAFSLGRAVPREGDGGFSWTSWPVLSLFTLAVAGVVAFVAWELETPSPLVDLHLFRNRTVRFGTAAAFALGGVFLTPMVFLPLFMVNVVGVTNTASGLTISPLVLGIVAGNVLSGQVVSRVGRYKPLMLLAIGLLTSGLLILGFTLGPDSTQREVTLKMIVLGLGLGPSIPIYTLAIQNAVELRHMGVATSMATFFRQMGSAVGVAVAGSFFAASLAGQLEARLPLASRDLPAELAQRVKAPAEEGGAVERGFDAEPVKVRAPEPLVGAALKASFSEAVTGVYRWDLVWAALALVLTLLLPELPLRKTHGGPPPVAE